MEHPFCPPSHPFIVTPSLGTLPALSHAEALLRCASAVAYESADLHRGETRHLALTVVHLVDMARTLVIQGLEASPATASAPAPEH